MAKKKSAARMGDFSLVAVHNALDSVKKRLKEKPNTPAKARLLGDVASAKAMLACDQGMYRQIAVATKKP
jgi:hypothetical protein